MTPEGRASVCFHGEPLLGFDLERQGPDLDVLEGASSASVLSGVVSFPRFLWFFTEAVWRQLIQAGLGHSSHPPELQCRHP